jgi:hypothetical protein
MIWRQLPSRVTRLMACIPYYTTKNNAQDAQNQPSISLPPYAHIPSPHQYPITPH